MTTTKYLTSRELAERWRMNPYTLVNWRVAGKGPPFVKLGKKVLYSLEVVEAWEKKNQLTSTVG